MEITWTVLSVSIEELKQGKNKQTRTTTKRTHNRMVILKNERKASWHRVEHFSKQFFFAFVFALLLLPLVPSCRSVVTTTFGHIQTYYLFIWLEHTKLLVVHRGIGTESSLAPLPFLCLHKYQSIRFTSFVNPVLFMPLPSGADVVLRYLWCLADMRCLCCP